MKKLLLLLFLMPNLVMADDFDMKNGFRCFSIDQTSQVNQISCSRLAPPKSLTPAKWVPTSEMVALDKNFCDPENFDFNAPISGSSSGTNARTQVRQDDCNFFAADIGLSDFDIASGSHKKCESRRADIKSGKLKNEIERWGAPAHKDNMYPGGKGLPYAKDSKEIQHERC